MEKLHAVRFVFIYFPLFFYHHNHRRRTVLGIKISLFHSLFDNRNGKSIATVLSEFRYTAFKMFGYTELHLRHYFTKNRLKHIRKFMDLIYAQLVQLIIFLL